MSSPRRGLDQDLQGNSCPRGGSGGQWSVTGHGGEVPGVALCSARTLVCVLRTVGFWGCPAACEEPPLCPGSPRPPGALPTRSLWLPLSQCQQILLWARPGSGCPSEQGCGPPTRQHPHNAEALMPVVRRVALWGTKLTWKEKELGVKPEKLINAVQWQRPLLRR